MQKKSVTDASSTLYKLLEPFESDDRLRIVRGTLLLLGELGPGVVSIGKEPPELKDRDNQGLLKDALTYFGNKNPQKKIEELATAARFYEKKHGASALHKEQFKTVFDDARRNFDVKNFSRDIDNARMAGFFNKGGSATTGYTLSYYGQNYIDQLPDRDAAKALKRPKKSGKRKHRKASP